MTEKTQGRSVTDNLATSKSRTSTGRYFFAMTEKTQGRSVTSKLATSLPPDSCREVIGTLNLEIYLNKVTDPS